MIKKFYSYGRFEVISGFVNGVFLIFIAFHIFIESVERLLDPPEVKSEKIILVTIVGLILNLIGLCFFHEHGHAESEGEASTKEKKKKKEKKNKSQHHSHSHKVHGAPVNKDSPSEEEFSDQ